MNNDFRLCPEFQQLIRQNGTVIENLGEGQVGYVIRLKLLPFLHVMAIPCANDPEILSIVDRLGQRYHFLNVSVFPKVIAGGKKASSWIKELRHHGYSPAKFGIAPTRTLILDLCLSDQELLNQMKEKTRYNIRLAQRRGVSTKVADGCQILANSKFLDEFCMVYQPNCRRVGIKSYPQKEIAAMLSVFKEKIFIVYAYSAPGNTAAVACYIIAGDTVWYHVNGSTQQGRHNFAPCLAVWEGIQEGKRRGCKWLDFDGIFDDRFKRAQRKWQGFSRFKTGFGGQEVKYLGSFVKWVPFLKN